MTDSPQPTQPKLLDPYKGELRISRLNADVADEDKKLIQSVFPMHGIIQLLVRRIYYALATDLRNANINSYDPEHTLFLEECILRRTSAIALDPKFDRYERRRVEELRKRTEDESNLRRSTQSKIDEGSQLGNPEGTGEESSGRD